jgi:uncharacterized protein (TIGR02266 family)
VDRENLRQFPRVPAHFSVDYTVGSKSFRCQASTLGGGGLFLEDSAAYPLGTELSLRFRPARHLPLVEASAVVRYNVPGKGCGVKFTRINPQHHEMILRLIHHKTGDKRKFPRVALATQIYCEALMSLAFSRDVSLGGMFIETHDPLPVGSQIELRFHLNDGGPIVTATAEVRYSVTRLGMGVQFIDMAPSDRKRIADYVAKSEPLSEPAATSGSTS